MAGGGVELVLTTLAFVGTIYYARPAGRELGLSIRKKKG